MALVVVLLLMAILLALGAFASRNTQVELQIARNQLLTQQALGNAEAGVAHALDAIRAFRGGYIPLLASGGTGGGLDRVGPLRALNGSNYRFSQSGSGSSDGYYVRLVDDHDEASGADDQTRDQNNVVKLISQGRVADATRVIEVIIGRSAWLGNSFFGRLGVTLTGGAVTDGYDSSVGAYNPLTTATAAGNVSSNGDITLKGNGTTVNGDATAGGTVDTGSGSVTGTTTNNAPPVTLPPVPPCGPPYSSGAGMSGSYNYSNGVLTASGNGSEVYLTAGTYCFDTVKLTGGAVLRVDGPVKLWLTGNGSFSGGSVVNTTQRAANLLVYSSYSGSAGMDMSGGNGSYMAIVAPDADVGLTGGSDFFGSIIGRSITNHGGTKMHADTSLNSNDSTTILGWHEVRNS
jgi:hypothetical protein